ncbi:MAG: hypothetical protein IT580_05540 [Verrucomicrobiales bacterium]|nr:hypothetical protein [Verrucomicrobiales bacterium]
MYPHLAMFNDENECGTGAVVPWAGRLWVVTYAPHKPGGSTDKLYEITPNLEQIVRPESVGGTPANRFVHRESNQLLIGPYLIDAQRRVRVLSPQRMPGRLTGVARHLTDPTNRVYYATMEEGFYDVDVQTLEIQVLEADANGQADHAGTLLPGYHGKGFYSGQGRVVYANNGELSPEAQRRPDIASGCLAEWDGAAWRVVRRNQFTEVTGPGGLRGNANPEHDPLWSIGWDHRSLILMVLEAGRWQAYRLPKASHAYDGAHGWNTEWPRIREIGDGDFLMTMHGTFWRFPRGFTAGESRGLEPRSTYLKVIGDFCRWDDRLVFGCDDTARSEFLNRRKAKGAIAGPGRSQSNLWFVAPETLDHLGPTLGRGAVWLQEDVEAGTPSDPYLFAGYRHRGMYLVHGESSPVRFAIEVDRRGDGRWRVLRTLEVLPGEARFVEFTARDTGAWVRLRVDRRCRQASAVFHYRGEDRRGTRAEACFDGLARWGEPGLGEGLLHAAGGATGSMRLVMRDRDSAGRLRGYELGGDLGLSRVEDQAALARTATEVAWPRDVLRVDGASVLYVDDRGRWRLPLRDDEAVGAAWEPEGRVCREVCTERDLFHAAGTFYELPAENAGGFAKIRPIATHDRRIQDFASYRGLLVLSGVSAGARSTDPRVVRSADGGAGLWVGVVDDLWKLGKARGVGGPWRFTAVQPGERSDPYLMAGYDRKSVALSHDASETVRITVELDLTGDGFWVPYRTFDVGAGRGLTHRFPAACGAYWVRTVADRACRATATFTYD